ncbi:MAG: tetratricopeptide repeat protein [Pseudomonadota bacterium]|nr:tetratricopeptide repeat protein [Pseudomonadota bacterium]
MIGYRFRFYLALAAAISLVAALPVAARPDAAARFDASVADAKAKMLIDPASAVVIGRAAESIAREFEGHQRTVATATAEWLQGEAYLRLHDLLHAKPLIDRALAAVTHEPSTKLTGDLLVSRGGIHEEEANVASALDDYQKAHNIFRSIGEIRSRALALMSIGLLYQEAKDYNNSLKYYNQAIDIYRGDPQII